MPLASEVYVEDSNQQDSGGGPVRWRIWVAECVRIWLTAPTLSSVLNGWRCYDGGSGEKERMWERKEWLPHCHPMLRKAVSQWWVGGFSFKNTILKRQRKTERSHQASPTFSLTHRWGYITEQREKHDVKITKRKWKCYRDGWVRERTNTRHKEVVFHLSPSV